MYSYALDLERNGNKREMVDSSTFYVTVYEIVYLIANI
jgi:hypothetical protein